MGRRELDRGADRAGAGRLRRGRHRPAVRRAAALQPRPPRLGGRAARCSTRCARAAPASSPRRCSRAALLSGRYAQPGATGRLAGALEEPGAPALAGGGRRARRARARMGDDARGARRRVHARSPAARVRARRRERPVAARRARRRVRAARAPGARRARAPGRPLTSPVVGTEVATVVALRHGRVLLVAQPRGGMLALPGGSVEAGESAREAAARELARGDRDPRSRPARSRTSGWRWTAPAASRCARSPRSSRRAAARRRSWRRGGSRSTRWRAPPSLRASRAACTRRSALAERAQAPPAELLEWWRGRAAALPWRATRDPYAVLVCEVMSQQTQIERVRERWERWIERWPTAAALAAASPGEVLRAWQGLGYPRRARDLHACARRIAREGWPARLTDLPGVGPYTADAIRCFAFEEPVLPRDANVRRVLARRFPGGVAGGLVGARGRADGRRAHALPRAPALRGLPAGARLPGRARGLLGSRGAPAPPGALRRFAAGAPRRAAARGARRRAPARSGRSRAARTLVADGLLALRDGVLVEPAAIVAGDR